MRIYKLTNAPCSWSVSPWNAAGVDSYKRMSSRDVRFCVHFTSIDFTSIERELVLNYGRTIYDDFRVHDLSKLERYLGVRAYL